jgi:phage terminase small subunit
MIFDEKKETIKAIISKSTAPSITKDSPWELLNTKQKLFCLSYLRCFNATKAYKETYPSVKSDEVAAVSGARLLRNDKVSRSNF